MTSPPRMPRVVFLGHSAALSGAELYLAGMLARTEAIDPLVVLTEDGPLVRRLESTGVEIDVVRLDEDAAGVGGHASLARLARSVGGLAPTVARLRARLQAAQADVVYTNSAKAHVLGLPVARSLGLPAVMHVHERLDAATYSAANRTLLRTASLTATRLIANSAWTRDGLPSRARGRAVALPCPTDVPPVAPALPATRPGELSLALVGRLTAWKGQDVALRALAALRRTRPDLCLSLHLYGASLFESDADYVERLHGLIAAEGLAERVHLHGHVDDVVARLAQHDAVLHTSVRPEPFGQVIVEAMAQGRPVVVTDAGGAAEIVTDGRDGLRVPPGDVGMLAASIVRLADDPALRRRLGAAAHERAADFSYAEVLPRWEAVLLEAAGGTGPRTASSASRS